MHGVGTGYSGRRLRAGQKDLNEPDQFDNSLELPGRTRTRHPEVPRQAPVCGLPHVKDDAQYGCSSLRSSGQPGQT
jgi:hypothetical protein